MNLPFHSQIRFVVTLLLITIMTCSIALAQRTSASISGIVADPSGALVPNAHVAAVSTSTGASVVVQTNDQGFFYTRSISTRTMAPVLTTPSESQIAML